MDRKQFISLKRGDIVQHIRTGNSFIIDSFDGKTYIGLDSIRISNPDEWFIVYPENKIDSKTVLQQPTKTDEIKFVTIEKLLEQILEAFKVISQIQLELLKAKSNILTSQVGVNCNVTN
jgi:hypothetical protein